MDWPSVGLVFTWTGLQYGLTLQLAWSSIDWPSIATDPINWTGASMERHTTESPAPGRPHQTVDWPSMEHHTTYSCELRVSVGSWLENLQWCLYRSAGLRDR